jgi:hypothetical protein
MSSRINDGELTSRIINLDFLRGLFIILALDQHFTYYINMWYVEYFKDTIALSTTYAVHFPMIGKQVSTDVYNHFLAVVFTPWVSQIYLTMASFNLARKSQADFQEGFRFKMKIFVLIFVYFVMENLIVAPNLGQGISFYPIMLWMVVLGMISFLYKTLGIRGVLALSFVSLGRFVIPMNDISDGIEDLVKTFIHPGFEYDARIEYFILSGCLGFIMGYVHYHLPRLAKRKDLYFSLMGLVLVLIYIAIGDPFHVYVDDVFSTEHDLARTFSGSAYVLGVQAIVISAFVWLESKNIILKFPLLLWVGVNSLLIFAFHRILFVKMIAPLSVLVGSLTGRTLGASIVETFVYIFITLGICYFIKKSRILDIIVQRK